MTTPPLPEYFDRLQPEMQAAILSIRELQAIQADDMGRVETRTAERMTLPVRATRRVRQAVAVSRHPAYWPCNPGFPAQKTCNSLFSVYDQKAGPYHDFHGDDMAAHPVVWKVCTRTHRPESGSLRYWCDAHLPGEYREIFGQEPLPEAVGIAARDDR